MKTARKSGNEKRRNRGSHGVRLGLEQLETRLLLDGAQPLVGAVSTFPLEPAGGPTESQTLISAYAAGGDSPPAGGAQHIISGVPNYLWHHGCGPTSSGMVVGYWDMHGFSNLIEGDSSTQTTAADDAMANTQHYNDYSLPNDEATPDILPDKSTLGGAHASNCIGDWMHTSWSSEDLRYGWSYYSDVGTAIDSYCNAKGYANFTTTNKTFGNFTWNDFKAEIDANRPMVLLVDSDGDGGTDHFVPAIGYDDATNKYACYDTWYTPVRWCDFIPMTTGHAWGVFGAIFVTPPPAAFTSPLVTPMTGTSTDTFTFSVHYQGTTPTSQAIVISNGVGSHNMILTSGIATDGVYSYSTPLAAGYYTYSFAFACGSTPVTSGTFAGPTVTGVGTDLSLELQTWTDGPAHAAMDSQHSDADGVPEGREAVTAKIRLRNTSVSDLTSVNAQMTTTVGGVTFTNTNVSYGLIASSTTADGTGSYSMYLGFDYCTDMPFSLAVSYTKNGAPYVENISFTQTFYANGTHEAKIDVVDSIVVSDSGGGDGDGVPESGERFAVDIYLKNTGPSGAVRVQAKISDLKGTGFAANLSDGWHGYPDIAAGAVQKESTAFDTQKIPTTFVGQLTADITVQAAGGFEYLFEDYPLITVHPAAWLSVEPSRWDFGASTNKVDVTKDVVVRNVGTAEMRITGLSTTSFDTVCQIATPTPATPLIIPAGGSQTVPVVIETAALDGTITRQVIVTSNARLVSTDPLSLSDRITITGVIGDLPPEITVLDDTTMIECGQANPVDLGSALHRDPGPIKTFTIRNDGMKPLKLTARFADTSHFKVSQPLKTTLAENETTTFTVTLVTTEVWSGSESISIANNDGGIGDGIENPFLLPVFGTVEGVAPEITVLDGTRKIVSGDTTPIDLGPTVVGVTGPSRIFTIRNDGDKPLLLTGFADTQHFSVGQPAKSSLAAGEFMTFTVTLKTTEAWRGAEQVSFDNNDGNGDGAVESPFNFTVGGAVYTSRVIVSDLSHMEGKSGITKFAFGATLLIPSTEPVTVAYSLEDGTATASDRDYLPGKGTLTFAPGVTQSTISAAVMGDTRYEGDETFKLVLKNTNGTPITEAIGTIQNDDKAPKISINDVGVKEGNSDTVNAVFTVSLSPASGRATVVQFSTQDGSAKAADGDYTPIGLTTITIPAGQTKHVIPVTIQGDTKYEANETFTVKLNSVEGAGIGRGTGTGTILNDKEDRVPTVSVSDVKIPASPTGGSIDFIVTLSALSGVKTTVHYATANGTAKAGKDYTAAGGTLTFDPGQTEKSVSIKILNDPSLKSDEAFYLKLSAPKPATLAKSKGTCTIQYQAPAPLLDALASAWRSASQTGGAQRNGPAVDEALRLLMLTG